MQQVNHSHTIIEIDNVSFSYTSEDVIKDVSLQVHKGDYVGIIGPNGGGKSTLLKLMLRVLKPTKGTVRLFGQDIKHLKNGQKLAMCPRKHFLT